MSQTGVISWSQTAASNATADSNINWAEGMAPSQVNDSARAEMASVAKWRDDNNGTIVTTGTTAAYTATSNQVQAALTDGYTVALKFHAANDSSATFAVDGLAAKNFQIIAGTNVSSGVFQSGSIHRFKYDSGSTAWVAQGGNLVQSLTGDSISDGTVTYNKIQTPGASKLLGNPSTSTSTNYKEITLGTNLTFSGSQLNAANNLPVVSVFTSSGAATWQSTTSNGAFPLYLSVRMVGGGGGGGAASANAGSSGTDTVFNNWTAIGGAKGLVAQTGGAGGSGGTNGTGTVIRRLSGQAGHFGNGTGGFGGDGGGSALGGGGLGTISSSGTDAVANTGAGGAGGQNGGSSGAGGGGAGEYVEFIITSPSTSYSYTVGGGGTGGTAGGKAGGTGAIGRIEVIAYWQ